jgi:hypothetical protein
MSKTRTQIALKELYSATQEASRALAIMSRSATRLSVQNTSTLYGVSGGFVGTGVAYGLSLALPVSLPIVAFIVTGFGVVGGVLFYRGWRRVDVESRLDENRLATEEILSRIKKLPKDAPQRVRDEMWRTYEALNSTAQFRRAMVSLPDVRSSENEPALLPSPTATIPELTVIERDDTMQSSSNRAAM